MSAELGGRYPDLAHLLGAYLNQDFDLYGPTLADAVRVFCDDDPPENVAAVREDIARFLRDHEADPDTALTALDPDHAQPPEMPARDYLLWLDAQMANALGAASARDNAAE